MITIKIKTWACPECGYKQDFEPTAENMATHFKGVEGYECPACASGRNPIKTLKRGVIMVKESNSNKKIAMNIQDTDEVVDEEQPTDEDTQVLGELERKLKLVNDMLEIEDRPAIRAKRLELEQAHSERKVQVKKVKVFKKKATLQEIKAIRDKYEDK